jgi:hypothetical protein
MDAAPHDEEAPRPLIKRTGTQNEWWVGSRTMLNPHGNIRICWDFLMCFFLSYTVFSEPVFMGFDVKPEGFFFVMENIVITYFLMDIVFNFRTAFESGSNKAVVTDGRVVAWRYITGWFLLDFVSSFPFSVFVEQEDLSATKNVKVIKSTKFYKVVSSFVYTSASLRTCGTLAGDENRAVAETLPARTHTEVCRGA